MQRGKKSVYNAATAMALTLVNGLLGMVVTKLIIDTFGSDFNGLNSTASQLVSILLLLEGGFNIATNVALFTPYHAGDHNAVNRILSATNIKFRKIGIMLFGVGIVAALVYTFIINSNLSSDLIFTVMMMAILPAAFNLFYATKYRILLQADQKEYIISIIALITISCGHILNIIVIILGGNMWMIRLATMLMALINSLMIGVYVKRHYAFMNVNVEPDYSKIKGTRDVLIQKIAGVIYNTAPILFISISPMGGTMLASVYAVYNNVFILLKGVLHGLIDAPRLGLGELVSYKEREEVWHTFKLYQLITFIALFALLSTAAVLIVPFVNIYTAGISDIDYQRPIIAILLMTIMFLEIIHIPSGHLINMSGNFRVSRQIQLYATAIIIVSMTLGTLIGDIYGILGAVLITALFLAVAEVVYIHRNFFNEKLLSFLRIVIPYALAIVPLSILEYSLLPAIKDYFSFFIAAFIVVVINTAAALVLGLIFNGTDMIAALKKASSVFRP